MATAPTVAVPSGPDPIQARYGSRACFYLTYGVRVLSGLLGAGMCVTSGIAFNDLHLIQEEEKTLAETNLPSSDPFYMGLQLFYLMIAGLLIVLSEVRVEVLKETVLRPFGFLHAWIGRGVFHVFLGTFMVSVDNDLARVLGGLLFATGFGQVLIGTFVFKGDRPDPKASQKAEAATVFGSESVINPAAQPFSASSTTAPATTPSAAKPAAAATSPAAPENPFLAEVRT